MTGTLIERAFTLRFSERSYPIETVEGRVPEFVRGTYYSNGPSRHAVGALRYRHLLDGDGMLRSLRFEHGGIRFANRFVRSRKHCEEQQAGAALYRTFGTRFPGDRLGRYGIGIESPVNVSAWRFAGSLLAFGEQGLPWQLDPLTLETRGPYTFGGALNEVSPFSAHPKIDPASGEMFNFGMSYSPAHPTLNLYRFDPRGAMVYRRRVEVPDPSSIHDFCLSPSYLIVYLNGHVLDMAALRDGGSTILEALNWEPERGASLLIASRETGERLARIPLERGYCLHTVNAFEKDGRLIYDVIELEEPVYGDYEVIPDIFTRVRPARPVRYVIDSRSWEVMERIAVPSKLSHDFPSVDPRRALRPNDHFWMLGLSKTGQAGRKYFDQLAHVDFSSGSIAEAYTLPERFYFGSEPTFLPDPRDASRGVVLCKRFDAERERDAYLLFDAHGIAAGPVAVLHLEEATPPCFHGSYYPS
ncbi:MAG: carotenoid oxygenase family protein [Vicinamibacteria bacterium]